MVRLSLKAMLQGVDPHLVQFLDIRIRRERVREDALNQIVGRPHELKKPLRVTFISEGVEEEGQDQVINLLLPVYFAGGDVVGRAVSAMIGMLL